MSIAKTLEECGAQVLAIDFNEDRVEEAADHVTHAVQADVTDLTALRSLGLNNFDGAVVAIGDNMETSIIAVMHLKDLQVPYIIVKAQNDLHYKVLERLGADRIVIPEKDMAERVGRNLVNGSVVDYIELGGEHGIYEIEALLEWLGKSIVDVNIRARYGMNVVAVQKANGAFVVSPGAQYMIEAGDSMVVVARKDMIEKLTR